MSKTLLLAFQPIKHCKTFTVIGPQQHLIWKILENMFSKHLHILGLPPVRQMNERHFKFPFWLLLPFSSEVRELGEINMFQACLPHKIISKPFSAVVSEERVAKSTARRGRPTPGHSLQREKIQLPNLIKNSLTISMPVKEVCGWRSPVVNCSREEVLRSK